MLFLQEKELQKRVDDVIEEELHSKCAASCSMAMYTLLVKHSNIFQKDIVEVH